MSTLPSKKRTKGKAARLRWLMAEIQFARMEAKMFRRWARGRRYRALRLLRELKELQDGQTTEADHG